MSDEEACNPLGQANEIEEKSDSSGSGNPVPDSRVGEVVTERIRDNETGGSDTYNEAMKANAIRVAKIEADAKKENYELKAEKHEQSNKLRRKLANAAITFVAVQLVVSDLLICSYVVFVTLMFGSVDSNVIIAWMSASLIEIIGILWVVARSLFPFHDKRRHKKAEKKGDGSKVRLDVS